MAAGATPPPGSRHGRGGDKPPDHLAGGESESVQGRGDELVQDSYHKQSYSDRLKTNVRFDQRLKRNILEITLEKSDTDANLSDVHEEDIARVLRSLGIDIAGQMQGYQVHYKGKVSVISVWMNAGVSLEKFCKDVNLNVTKGIMTGVIRPAGKTDVTVKIEGLDLNTPDNLVTDYLGKFGSVKTDAVIYGKHDAGPFKGKYNGERRYQVDFTSAARQMGTFHLVDGNKIKIFYRGNKKTCGRCHKMAHDCPGDAVARNCALAGGERVLLSNHMKALWEEIGFAPAHFELDEVDKTYDDVDQAAKDAPKISKSSFPLPVKYQAPSPKDIEKFDGLTKRNIPKSLTNEEIKTFLANHGLPADLKEEHININNGERNTHVIIENLSPEQVQTLQKSIHFHDTNTKFFNVPLFCKPRRILTPIKHKAAIDDLERDVTSAETLVEKAPAPHPKPLIPGLPESERLKRKKSRKKNMKSCERTPSPGKLQAEHFLHSPSLQLVKSSNISREFVFSEYEDEETESGDDKFEDSLEQLNEDKLSDMNSGGILSSAFKRSAWSPADQKNNKKPRNVKV